MLLPHKEHACLACNVPVDRQDPEMCHWRFKCQATAGTVTPCKAVGTSSPPAGRCTLSPGLRFIYAQTSAGILLASGGLYMHDACVL